MFRLSHRPAATEEGPPTGTDSAAVSNAVVRLMREYTGRGPTKCRTIINRDMVVVLLEDTMTRAEQKLTELGRGDYVLQTRRVFQKAMRAEMILAIEVVMQRQVIALMGDNITEPDMAVEVFIFEPQAADGVGVSS